MPRGIDTIIMHEKCNRVGDEVIIRDIIKKNQNMRPVGENLRKGEIVVEKGKLLNAADIGQLAASGNSNIEVYKKLSVSVISTGDELIDPLSKNKLKGQIFDSNKPMLTSLLSIHYLKVLDLGIVKDNRTQLAEKYAEALIKSDVVISSGGASDGIEDHTQNALKDIGAKCLVWQLAMKPGKPMAIGMLGKKIIFCLPGNPVAAFVCTKLLINPILMKLAGGTDWDPLSFKLPSGFDHQKRNGRAEFLRAKIINKDQRSFIYLHGRKGAGVISSLTGADGIVEIPLEAETVSKGDFLKFYPFDYRGL
jgi:molybdopterin molybdotransferase